MKRYRRGMFTQSEVRRICREYLEPLGCRWQENEPFMTASGSYINKVDCDFYIFTPIGYIALECKETARMTLPKQNIRKHQLAALLRYKAYFGCIAAGFLVGWRKHKRFTFHDAEQVADAKSINPMDGDEYFFDKLIERIRRFVAEKTKTPPETPADTGRGEEQQ